MTHHCTLGHLSARIEDLFSHRSLYASIYNSFICDTYKLESTHKQIVVHLYHRIQLSNKNEQITEMWNNLDGPQQNLLTEKANVKKMDLNEIILIENASVEKIYCIILFMLHIWNNIIAKMENRLVVARG